MFALKYPEWNPVSYGTSCSVAKDMPFNKKVLGSLSLFFDSSALEPYLSVLISTLLICKVGITSIYQKMYMTSEIIHSALHSTSTCMNSVCDQSLVNPCSVNPSHYSEWWMLEGALTVETEHIND